ncbi:MAG: gfo/Idh/MocA family oxidoreductase, partial [Sphaerospermopsis sp. SIO1G2]|nr:gfo/Idh/MocA family oxidoreductase [Sphaerospermopsis sp. SIO1G2]
FNTWLGMLPIKVKAKGTVWLQEQSNLADLVWVTLTYPNNFQAYIHLCWLNTDKQRRLGLVGSQGSLIFDEMSATSPLSFIHGEFAQEGDVFIPINQNQEVLDIGKSEPLAKVCDCFVNCVLNSTPSLVSSGWVGRELVEILTALTKSLQEDGKSVKITNG